MTFGILNFCFLCLGLLIAVGSALMGDATVGRYWCHMCSRAVNPVMGAELKCPTCDGGFLEEMESWRRDAESDSDRALSMWAPILLGMMGPSRRRRRFRRGLEDDDEEDDGQQQTEEDENSDEFAGDGELEAIQRRRRRRRNGLAILQLLQSLREGMASETMNSDTNDRDSLILINPFNQAIILQGSRFQNQGRNPGTNIIGASLGDYFVGPGLDLLLQHLAENDPSMYGTPPAQKIAVEAMPTVKICENLRCAICIEDFEIGSEGREMPCKHHFHAQCILPWLELHSSCPVCRYQMPVDEPKELQGSMNSDHGGNNVENDEADPVEGHGEARAEHSEEAGIDHGREARSENGSESMAVNDGEDRTVNFREARGEHSRRFWMPIPWPFSGLFSQTENSSPGSSSEIGEN